MKKNNYNIEIFNSNFLEYDRWYDDNADIFMAEIKAIKKLCRFTKNSVEIGCGTGRFSSELGIKTAVEPGLKISEIARKRKIDVINATGEKTPFESNFFSAALISFVLEFVKKPKLILKEAYRILKIKGKIVIGFINRRKIDYEKMKKKKFYKKASFFSFGEIKKMLSDCGFVNLKAYGIVIENNCKIKIVNDKKNDFEKSYVFFISAQKK